MSPTDTLISTGCSNSRAQPEPPQNQQKEKWAKMSPTESPLVLPAETKQQSAIRLCCTTETNRARPVGIRSIV